MQPSRAEVAAKAHVLLVGPLIAVQQRGRMGRRGGARRSEQVRNQGGVKIQVRSEAGRGSTEMTEVARGAPGGAESWMIFVLSGR